MSKNVFSQLSGLEGRTCSVSGREQERRSWLYLFLCVTGKERSPYMKDKPERSLMIRLLSVYDLMLPGWLCVGNL